MSANRTAAALVAAALASAALCACTTAPTPMSGDAVAHASGGMAPGRSEALGGSIGLGLYGNASGSLTTHARRHRRHR